MIAVLLCPWLQRLNASGSGNVKFDVQIIELVDHEHKRERRTCSNPKLVMEIVPGTEAVPPLQARPIRPATTPPPTTTDAAVEETTVGFISY